MTTITQHGPIDPLQSAYKAARIVAGELDAGLKRQEPNDNADSAAGPSSSATKDDSPLARLLRRRLIAASKILNELDSSICTPSKLTTEDELHSSTAEAALACLSLIDLYHRKRLQSNQLLGSRDRKTTQTLLSLAAKWGLEPALLQYDAALEDLAGTKRNAPRFEEVDDSIKRKQAYQASYEVACVRLSVIYRSTIQLLRKGTSFTNEEVASSLLLDAQQPLGLILVAASVRLCWGPVLGRIAQDKDAMAARSEAKDIIPWMMKTLAQAVLLPLLSSVTSPRGSTDLPSIPPFAKHFATRLLSAQLLRREGVVALISTLMSPGSEAANGNDLTSSRKMDRLVTLLTTPPAGMAQSIFLSQHTVPTLLHLLTTSSDATEATNVFATVAANVFAAVFSQEQSLLETHLKPMLWDVLNGESTSTDDAVLANAEQLHRSIDLLDLLVIHSPPSTEWLRWLMSPVVLRLWQALEALNRSRPVAKVSEMKKPKAIEQVKLQVGGLLQRWLAIAEINEIKDWLKLLKQLATSTESRGHFEVSDDGQLTLRAGRSQTLSMQAQQPDLESLMSELAMPSALTSEQSQKVEEATSLELLGMLEQQSRLEPSPELITTSLARAQRIDVASALLPELLEQYLQVKAQSKDGSASDVEEGEVWHYLQCIVSLLDAFGDRIVKSDEAGRQNALRFVNISLAGDGIEPQLPAKPEDDSQIPLITPLSQSSGSRIDDLLNVSRDSSSTEERRRAPAEPVEDDIDEDLSKTAIDLLLSILEGDETLSPTSNPLLALVHRKLGQPCYAAHQNEDLRRLIKEAQLVLLARVQKDKTSQQGEQDGLPLLQTPQARARTEVRASFEEALKYLQDPILPIRAQGLVVLTQVVSSSSQSELRASAVGELLSQIKDIFLQALGDEESYLYLNAIKGVQEVILLGNPHMTEFLDRYTARTSSSSTSAARQAIDEQLRLGEAFLGAIQKLAEGGAAYVDVLLPPLLQALRDSSLPTTLRSSILSLLGTCIEAFPLALASSPQNYTRTLCGACIDLLKIESVQRKNGKAEEANEEEADEDEEEEAAAAKRRIQFAPGADDAVGLDTSYPQLRRGALLLLHLLIKGSRDQLEMYREDKQQGGISMLRGGEDEGSLQQLRLPGGQTLPSLAINGLGTKTSTLPPLLLPVQEAGGFDLLRQIKTLTTYLQDTDDDALVRSSANAVKEEAEGLELEVGLSALGS